MIVPPQLRPDTFDYIIVGAGSAGCVLANRLTEDGRSTVLLIEGGGSDRHLLMAMPSALAMAMNIKRANWNYESEPEPAARRTAHLLPTRQGDRRLVVD